MDKLDVLSISLVNLNILAATVDQNILKQECTLLQKYDVIVGGDGTNQMVVMSKFGRKVGICGVVGDDAFGDVARDLLLKNGVDINYLANAKGERTAVCFVLIMDGGKHHFLVQRGACDKFEYSDIDINMLDNTKILNIGSLYTFKRLYGEALAGILKEAKKRGVITSADCMHDSYSLGSHAMDCIFPHLDYFLPSREEAEYITGRTDPKEMAQYLLDKGVGHVVIKLGGEGCFSMYGNEGCYYPALKVPVIDTTGAGDTFIAGFLHGILEGWPTEKCCRFATAASAITVGAMGATGAIKDAGQVQTFLDHII